MTSLGCIYYYRHIDSEELRSARGVCGERRTRDVRRTGHARGMCRARGVCRARVACRAVAGRAAWLVVALQQPLRVPLVRHWNAERKCMSDYSLKL